MTSIRASDNLILQLQPDGSILERSLPIGQARLADIEVTLVELFAYMADVLAYYQDRIATEAYLETPRHRTAGRVSNLHDRFGTARTELERLGKSLTELLSDASSGDDGGSKSRA